MKEGYSFIWEKGGSPYFIRPDGFIVIFAVEGDIPYLKIGDKLSQPVEHNQFRKYWGYSEKPALPADADPAEPNALSERFIADSIGHLLNHKPSNKHCDGCALGKMKDTPRFRGAFADTRVPAAWGDIVTFDFVSSEASPDDVFPGAKSGFVIADLWSKLKNVFPVDDRSAQTVTTKIKHFCGTRKITLCYSDGAPEFHKACAELAIPHDKSQPGHPQNNAKAERTVQDILQGTRATLRKAGLPAVFWVFAAPCYALHDNVTQVDGHLSPWEKTHGK